MRFYRLCSLILASSGVLGFLSVHCGVSLRTLRFKIVMMEARSNLYRKIRKGNAAKDTKEPGQICLKNL
jgi:hypothetical protein